jgi:hypothetical protein
MKRSMSRRLRNELAKTVTGSDLMLPFGEEFLRPGMPWYRRESAATTFMERIVPIIDQAIDDLVRTTFDDDPIVDPYYSRIASIVASAQKRQGRIIECAFREAFHGAGYEIKRGHGQFDAGKIRSIERDLKCEQVNRARLLTAS